MEMDTYLVAVTVRNFYKIEEVHGREEIITELRVEKRDLSLIAFLPCEAVPTGQRWDILTCSARKLQN